MILRACSPVEIHIRIRVLPVKKRVSIHVLSPVMTLPVFGHAVGTRAGILVM